MELSDERPATKGPGVISARQAAKLLAMERSAVRRLLEGGQITGQKTPEGWEIPVSEVTRWATVRAALRSGNLLTPARAARELGISRQAVHQKVRAGRLGSRMVGSRRLIPKSVLEEELRKRKHEGLWDVKTVCRVLGLTRLQVYQLVRSGRLRADKIGNFYFFSPEAVQRLKRSGSKP